MKNLFLITIIFSILTSASVFSQEILEDVVHLKNGSVIRGVILEQIPNVSIKIKTKDGNVFVFKMQDISKITKEKQVKKQVPNTRRKSPGTAIALSLLTPGIGQFYNGDVGKGFIHLSVHLVSVPASIIVVAHDEEDEDYLKVAFIAIAGVNYIWSLVDASSSAKRINKRRKQSYGHQFEYDYKKHVVGIDIGKVNNVMGGQVSIHF